MTEHRLWSNPSNKVSALRQRQRITDLLKEQNKVSDADIQEALRLKAKEGLLIGQAMVRLGLISEEDVARAVASTNDLDYVDPAEIIITPELKTLLPRQLAERYRVLPLRKTGSGLEVASDRPLSVQVLRNLEGVAKTRIRQLIASTANILDGLEQFYDEASIAEDNTSVVDTVDQMISRAIRMKASDIHLEPFEDRICLRMRVDGMLKEITTFATDMLAGITSRIKVMADLNIAEKRAPQDGAISYRNGRHDYDLRISIIPSLYGEKVVIRLLSGSSEQLQMKDIGLGPANYERFQRIINRPYGILLIVGPTGSGKSTTLCAALNTIKGPEINITTVEDPVEYKIDGITQVHVGQSDKIDFAGALRAILRQDPDVIMIGEVRDSETADIALRAALTGHMVFTTLHTNDAPSALPRLVDMGCEPFLVSSAVRGILAQRLMRRVCPRCRQAYQPSREELLAFGLDPEAPAGPWYRKQGCPACNGSGYKGRIGIFELLEVNDAIRKEVMACASADTINQVARETAGMKTLREDAVQKVLNGTTTVEEVFRVTLDD
jgi:type IV pilus assembly protein PilB